MAPEQIMGHPTAQTDIYAMGVIADEMVTGRTPFQSSSTAQLYSLQADGIKLKPKDIRRDLPHAADEIILKALSFNAEERYARADTFATDLADALELEQVSLRSDSGNQTSPETGHVIAIEVIGYRSMPMDQQLRQHRIDQAVTRYFTDTSSSKAKRFHPNVE